MSKLLKGKKMLRISVAILVAVLSVSLATAALAAGVSSPLPSPSGSPSPSPTSTPAAKILDTSIVTAQRRPTTIRSTSRETYVVTEDDLRSLGAPTVSDALAFVPGVFIKANGAFGGVESALMRGASSEQTLVLIDGRPAGDADLGDFDFTSIASDAVSRVEVVEGGASTLYGSNAVGGVINIITGEPGSSRGGTVYQQLGFEGAGATGVRISAGDVKTLATTISVRSSHARNQFDYPAFASIPAGTRIDDDSKVQDATVGIARQFGVVRGTLRLNNDANDFGAPGDLEFCQAPPNNAFCPSGLARQQRVWGRSDAQFEWQAGAHALSVQGYADGRRLHFFDASPSFPFDTMTTLATRGAGVRDVWTANASNVIVAGLDTRGDRAAFAASFYAAPTVASDATTAWYAEDDLRAPASPLSLTFGLREERPQGTKPVAVPSFGVDERIGGGVIRANYARSFRTPTLDERYFPNFGTPTLQPEYGATFDAGVTQPVGAGLASLTYFGTDTSNLIVDVTIDSFGDVAPENVARARVRGFDTSFRMPLGNGYALNVSYTDYPVARDLTKGTRLLYRPSATGGLRLQHDSQRGAYGVDVRYVGRRYADEANVTLLPQFASVGAFLTRSIGGGTSVSLRADNITGERVPASYGYPVMGPTLSLTVSQSWRQ
jgi:vitamin B12 transporter